MNYYTAKEACRILSWPHGRIGWLRLQKMAHRNQIRTIRKKTTKRARISYSADDVKALATKLDILPRDGVLVGEAARKLRVHPMTVLRKKGLLGAVRHPISGYWLFPMIEIKNYLSKKL